MLKQKIIVFILIIFYFLFLKNYNKNGFEYFNQSKGLVSKGLVSKALVSKGLVMEFELKDTPKMGRGVFATKDYKIGDIIESCPTLVFNNYDVKNRVRDYIFDANDINGKKNQKIFPFGYCSLINHSKPNQNCTWKIKDDNSILTMYATKKIKRGEEILTNYGNNYWNSRKSMEEYE